MGDDYNLLSVQNAADAVATVNEYKVNAVLLGSQTSGWKRLGGFKKD